MKTFILAATVMFFITVGTILIVEQFGNGYLYGTPLGLGLALCSLKLFPDLFKN